MKRIKKVLFISSLYRPNFGGVETVVEELSHNYQKRGMEVVVLTKRFPFDLAEKEMINGVMIYRLLRPKSDLEFMESIDWIRKYQKELKADVIHIIQIHRPMPLIALLLARLWKVPFVVNYAGGDVLEPGDPSTQQIWKEGKGTVEDAVLQGDWHVSFSKGLTEDVKMTIPKVRDLDLVYAGINVNEIANAKPYNPGYPYIVTVRRLVEAKGIDILINAFKLVVDKVSNLHLVIVGDGPERTKLESLVERLNIQDRVHFIGSVKQEETFSYLRGSVAHVCPSRAEAGGVINFAAQAAKTVAIGSNVGGIPEYIIDKKSGLLYENGNVDELSKLIIKVCSSKEFRDKLTKFAWINIQQFDWEKISSQYLDGYSKVIDSSARKSFIPWSDLSANMWKKLNK